MKTYTQFSTRETSQKKKIPGTNQVKNSAGGYAWAVDDWVRLDRFLVLGSEGGTYYIGEQQLTQENAKAAVRCIANDGRRVVERVTEISVSGRAPKNDPALFVLAMCAGLGDVRTRRYAMTVLPQVARIGTHLFHFLTYVQQFRGWGPLLRDGVSTWYTSKDVDRLAYQLIKYRQRDGWSHRDVLRKAHPARESHNDLFHWVTQGEAREGLPALINGYIACQNATNAKQVAALVRELNLPREAIPTEFLNDIDVWQELLRRMPMTAMIRNLGKMTSMGLLKPMDSNISIVTDALSNQGQITKSRVHPLTILVALKTYSRGSGVKGSLKWRPVSQIVDALDNAFYLSFGNVKPSNKNTLLAIDVSGSMTWGEIAGMTGVTPRDGSAAMALITANVEPNYHILGFSDRLVDIPISPKNRLDDVSKRMSRIPMGGTDCALPMIHALNNGMNVDTFVVYTDSETWAGKIHPSQALVKYREATGINAKLVIVGMLSNGFSIADPNDAGMLDVVGFDTATPNIISEFSKE
jgi:60 kDa SS-A/Ro ribonucleoprotein